MPATAHRHRVQGNYTSPYKHCANPDDCEPKSHGFWAVRQVCVCGTA